MYGISFSKPPILIATPPLSESRRRVKSMSSRPHPRKSSPSPSHAKPKPSRPPPPSKVSKSSSPQPTTQGSSTPESTESASLPIAEQPTAVAPNGGRPHSKSSGDVHTTRGRMFRSSLLYLDMEAVGCRGGSRALQPPFCSRTYHLVPACASALAGTRKQGKALSPPGLSSYVTMNYLTPCIDITDIV